MEMRTYLVYVVPAVVIFYGVFVLFMRPPVKVIGATIVGGLVMALLNMLGDSVAIHASLWYYNASGLVAQLPLPLYTTSWLILGGLAYLLIWRYWHSSKRWATLLVLSAVPIFGFLRDYWQTNITRDGFLTWLSPLAAPVDVVFWFVMFFAGYVVFRTLVPKWQAATAHEDAPAEAMHAVERQK